MIVIPPRESIPENRKRLTVDLRLRSGASLHLTWSQHASDKAKNSPVLNDELMKQAKELPKPVEPADYGSASGSGGKNGESEGKAGGKEAEKRAPKDRGGIEGKLKGLLRLSKK